MIRFLFSRRSVPFIIFSLLYVVLYLNFYAYAEESLICADDIGLFGGVWYADDDWNDTYFGVNSNNVGDSGLPFYEADSGLNEVFLGTSGLLYLSKNWVLAGGVRYSRLTGDAEDSPVVDGEDGRGDANQWIAGLGIAYIFCYIPD